MSDIPKFDVLPEHIGIIMDGNGRWAKQRGLKRTEGHKEGAKVFKRICEYASDIGIKYLTFYAFSTENWKRPQEEVSKIMSLLERYLDRVIKHFSEYDIQLRFIGEREGLSEKLVSKIENAERLTSNKTRILNIALNYGSRAELVSAVNNLLAVGKEKILTGKLVLQARRNAEINEKLLLGRRK